MSLLLSLLFAATAQAADFRDLPRLPTPGIPLNAAPAAPSAPALMPLLESLAAIPIIQTAPDAPPRLESLFQLDALTASFSKPAPGGPAALLESFWSGVRAAAPGGIVDPVKPRQAATVADVLNAAWESPTGRDVLRKAEKLARKTGERVPVVLKPLGNNYGEYDYVDRVLYISKDLAAGDVNAAAATLIHELVHVLQHTRGIPAESLEMELEAHVVTLQVLDELGVPETLRGGFSNAALRELQKSPGDYETWMAGQLPGKARLAGADFDELQDDLEQEASDLAEKAEGLKNPAAKARVAARLAAVERDLAVLRSPAGRKRCKDFAAHVKRVVAAYARTIARR